MIRLSRFARIFLAGALSVAALYPQSADTGFLGTITDATGAVVAGAPVVVTQPATGTVRNVTSSPTGSYEVRYLQPGEYVVEVRMTGFRSEKSSEITLRLAQMVRLDFTLQVGEVTEQVQVNAQGVMLETQSGVLGGVVTRDSVVNLPLNGRNFIQLGNLTPGVISSGGTTSGSFRANGARSGYQQISFDGVTAVNNRATNEFMFPSVDAVQEFKVQSSNYSAEYGGHAGANVQLQLRSGTNQFHGTAFDFLRNDVLDARGFFRPAPLQKPTLRRNQYGGVVTGPIIRDKTFFMGSYEGLKERRSTASTTSVPTEAQRRGDLSGLGTITDPLTGAPFANGLIPQNRLNAGAVKILNENMVLPNLPGATNNYAGVTASKIDQDQYLGRIDHMLGAKDQVFGHYVYHGGLYPSININPFFGTLHYLRNQNVAVQYLHTFNAAKLNEFRFGYSRGTKVRLSPRAGTDFTAEKNLGISGLKVGGPNGRPLQDFENGFPQINISGYAGMGDSTGGEALDSNSTYQGVDNFSYIRGKHSFKTGADVRYLLGTANSTNVPFGQLNFARDIAGHPLASYLLGYPKTVNTPEGILLSAIRQWRYGFYFQDDWRVNSRLTLNLGVRYDLNLLPHDINGASRTLRFDLDPKGPVLWPAPGEKVDLFIKEHNHVAPRVGFAYRLRNNLVLRGGYGIFTMAAHFDEFNILQINPPNASILLTNPNTNPVATIQNPLPASLLPTPLIYNVVSTEVDRKHLDGYYQNWNLSGGYEITRNDILEIGYAGSKGTHLDTSHLNLNSPLPDPAARDIQSRRPYPQIGRIRMWGVDGNSNYHSLQARFEHRFSHGLSLTMAHTWSHLIDDQQGGLNGSRALAQDPRNLRGNMRADSADDVRHSFVAGYVWDIPYGSQLKGIPGAALKGWKFGGIITLRSGSPLLITQDGDTLNTDAQGEIRPNSIVGVSPILPGSDRTLDRYFNTAAFTRATVTYGTAPRNPVAGPGIKTADLSMSKTFKLMERHSLEFRWEAFNALNTPQFSNPGGQLGSTNFGRITGTRINNREMQVALKYMF
jgi:hypothetical protein